MHLFSHMNFPVNLSSSIKMLLAHSFRGVGESESEKQSCRIQRLEHVSIELCLSRAPSQAPFRSPASHCLRSTALLLLDLGFLHSLLYLAICVWIFKIFYFDLCGRLCICVSIGRS